MRADRVPRQEFYERCAESALAIFQRVASPHEYRSQRRDALSGVSMCAPAEVGGCRVG